MIRATRHLTPLALALCLLIALPLTTEAQQVRSRGAFRGPDGLPHVDPARLEATLLTLGEIGVEHYLHHVAHHSNGGSGP